MKFDKFMYIYVYKICKDISKYYYSLLSRIYEFYSKQENLSRNRNSYYNFYFLEHHRDSVISLYLQ